MTNQQLKLVIESAEKGSISAAAEKLCISQPNASQSIKKLEEELCYQLFLRTGTGISPTEQGYLFLEHARVLLEEDRAIRAIKSEVSIPKLRIGVTNITVAVDAFLRFCEENHGLPECNLACINASAENGIRLLADRKLDVSVAVCLRERLSLLETLCSENRLSIKTHVSIPVCVRVRRDHPLVLDGTLDGSYEGFKHLSSYPFAEYMHLEHMTDTYNRTTETPFGYSYKIYVDERETRLKLVSCTDAYNMGLFLSGEICERYGLAMIPMGTEVTLVTMVRKGDENLPDIVRYREILDETADALLSEAAAQ